MRASPPNTVSNAALEAPDGVKSTDAGYIGRLARPWRDGAEARDYQDQLARLIANIQARAVGQQSIEDAPFGDIELALEINKVIPARGKSQ